MFHVQKFAQQESILTEMVKEKDHLEKSLKSLKHKYDLETLQSQQVEESFLFMYSITFGYLKSNFKHYLENWSVKSKFN